MGDGCKGAGEDGGGAIKARKIMYGAVVQVMLLYGIESWFVMNMIMGVLEIFHHSIVRWILVMTVRKGDGVEWGLDLVDAELDITGIFPIREYMRRRHETIVEYA